MRTSSRTMVLWELARACPRECLPAVLKHVVVSVDSASATVLVRGLTGPAAASLSRADLPSPSVDEDVRWADDLLRGYLLGDPSELAAFYEDLRRRRPPTECVGSERRAWLGLASNPTAAPRMLKAAQQALGHADSGSAFATLLHLWSTGAAWTPAQLRAVAGDVSRLALAVLELAETSEQAKQIARLGSSSTRVLTEVRRLILDESERAAPGAVAWLLRTHPERALEVLGWDGQKVSAEMLDLAIAHLLADNPHGFGVKDFLRRCSHLLSDDQLDQLLEHVPQDAVNDELLVERAVARGHAALDGAPAQAWLAYASLIGDQSLVAAPTLAKAALAATG